MLRLPPGDLFLILREEETDDAERFLIAGPNGEICLALFSDEARGRKFLRSLYDDGWELVPVPREVVLRLLEDHHELGLTHVALDPPPDYLGPGQPIFSVLVESL